MPSASSIDPVDSPAEAVSLRRLLLAYVIPNKLNRRGQAYAAENLLDIEVVKMTSILIQVYPKDSNLTSDEKENALSGVAG